MLKTHSLSVIAILCTCCLGLSCTSIRRVPASEDSGANAKLKRIQSILESSLNNHKDSDAPSGLKWSAAVRDVVGALTVCDPAQGIELFEKLDTLHKGGTDQSVETGTAMLMMRILKESDRDRFIELCREKGDRELKSTVVEVMKVNSEKDFMLAAAMVDPSAMPGDATLLLAACDLKSIGQEWKKALEMAAFSTEENFIADPTLLIGALLRAYLNDDGKKAGEIMNSVTGLKGKYEVASFEASALPVKFMRDRKDGDKLIESYMEFINRSCTSLPEDKAFTMMAFMAKHYPDNSPEILTTAIKNRWKKEFLSGELSAVHFATFYAARSLNAFHPEWSCQASVALINSLFSQKNPESHYHMTGTALGILARKDARSALKLANRIKSMEWIVNAKRCIYRGWAMRDPEEALESAKKEYLMSGDVGKRLRADLILEAAVGASLAKPELAAEAIASLPDSPVRFGGGYCLIAPSMARVDLEKAVSLVIPKGASGDPVPADSAHALAVMVLDIANIPIDPTFPRFYPDLMSPRDQWPGPYFSEPIRF